MRIERYYRPLKIAIVEGIDEPVYVPRKSRRIFDSGRFKGNDYRLEFGRDTRYAGKLYIVSIHRNWGYSLANKFRIIKESIKKLWKRKLALPLIRGIIE